MTKIKALLYRGPLFALIALFSSFAPQNAHSGDTTIDACQVPTKIASSQDELAWQLFVAINCKVNGKLTWETWKTQACLNNPSDCTKARLSGSLLRDSLATSDNPRRTQGCSPMTTTATADPSLIAFVPKNLSAKPVFCEEVVINAAEEAYLSLIHI